MAELTTLARPYAKAAFEYARDAKQIDAWAEGLSVAAAVAQQEVVVKLLASPAYTSKQQAQSLAEVCGDKLNDKVQNFIYTLADNKRLALLPEINALFAAFKAQQEKAVELKVTSAFELSEATQEKLAKALAAKLDREVSVEASIDESLIGGVVIRAGDTVIDGSVRGRLAKLAEVMNA